MTPARFNVSAGAQESPDPCLSPTGRGRRRPRDLDPRPLPTWRTPYPTLIGIRWPASESRRTPPPRPAKRGEGWGEGRRQAGPLIPTFSPADRGEGVTALSVKPRSMPMLRILSPTAHGYPDLRSQVVSGTRIPRQGLPFFGRSSGRIASPAQRERPPTEGRRERVRAHGTPAPCLKPCLPSPGALRAPASPRCAPLRGARHVAAGSPAGAVTLTPGEAR